MSRTESYISVPKEEKLKALPERFSFDFPEAVVDLEDRTEAFIDTNSRERLQLSRLHEAIDTTITEIGSLTLLRSLNRPSTSLPLIHAKQEAYQELRDRSDLQSGIRSFLGDFSQKENNLYTLSTSSFYSRTGDFYTQVRNALAAGASMGEGIKDLPRPESVYLQDLFSQFDTFSTTRSYQLLRGPIYRGWNGIRTNEEKSPLNLLRFHPTSLTIGTAVINSPHIFLLVDSTIKAFNESTLDDESAVTSMLIYAFYMMTLGMPSATYPIIGKNLLDDRTILKPLGRELVRDKDFLTTLTTLGKLDEISGITEWANNSPQQTTLPTITDDPTHHFEAKGLRNPILTAEKGDSTPIDIDLNTARLTFITGPNSGGKTTSVMTISHSQIMGLNGGPILASEATINIADHIAIHIPEFSALEENNGRFGEEVVDTKNIFMRTTPRSLVFLEELGEGTTSEEKQVYATSVLKGFKTKRSTTVFVTHSHELADKFQEEHDDNTQFLKVGFEEDVPTFQLEPGISYESHALRVAKENGFAPEDIQQMLVDEGYVEPGQGN